ncbi:hypothetical protein, partial [Frankia sp. AgKG'84/4]|uniref:hypothetical protein n=1 Tax=Frankia sp. AgKG'84/4 TaxID=573490 RepID=UPI00202A5DF5
RHRGRLAVVATGVVATGVVATGVVATGPSPAPADDGSGGGAAALVERTVKRPVRDQGSLHG